MGQAEPSQWPQERDSFERMKTVPDSVACLILGEVLAGLSRRKDRSIIWAGVSVGSLPKRRPKALLQSLSNQ